MTAATKPAPVRKPLAKGTLVTEYFIVFEHLYAGMRLTGNCVSKLDYKKEIDEEYDIRMIEAAISKTGKAEVVVKSFQPLRKVKVE